MAKKTNYRFEALLTLNPEKGGAWLAVVRLINGDDETTTHYTQAWKNASAGKKYIKAMVQELTPRKSVKMVAGEALNDKGKPVQFTGELIYKA